MCLPPWRCAIVSVCVCLSNRAPHFSLAFGGAMCCFSSLVKLLPCHGRKKNKSKAEIFITPFEAEMVPMLLKELHNANERFYEVVCFRWYKETAGGELAQEKNGTTPLFDKEGLALRLLVNRLARSLLEKGVCDEDTESSLEAFRIKSIQRHTTKPQKRKRSLGSGAQLMRTPSESTDRVSMKIFRSDASSLRVPDPGAPRRRFSLRKSSTTAAVDALFFLLGEILVRQFQCTINMEEGNVHERELKLIIWKHFVQTLVGMLVDKERFP